MRPLLSLAAAASLLVAQAPVLAEGTADDIGVMSVLLKETVKPRFGVQGQTQGAGTPNQAGVGGFLPISVGDNSVFYADVEVNADFGDYSGYSSIINTTVAGTTVSTSSRLGYRWLNSDRSWMYGLNAGYDSRSLKSGNADTGVSVTNKKTIGFQQIALNAEAVSNGWTFNGYGLIPVGDVEQKLNSVYQGGALNTYGLDVGYFITPSLQASVGYYYQHRDQEEVDGSGILGRLAYAINNDLTVAANLSYDEAFDTRFSADLTWRFNTNGGPGNDTPKANNAVKALTSTPSNRDVRVHDCTVYINNAVHDCTALPRGALVIPFPGGVG